MSQRRRIPNGGIMMVTSNTLHRAPIFEDAAYAREAIECLFRVKRHYPFKLFAFVIMHDHYHFLLTVPRTNTISRIMNSYKSGLTFDIGVPKIWQPRFDVRIVKNPIAAMKYIHMNPVATGMVNDPKDYHWSSASGLWSVDPLPLYPAAALRGCGDREDITTPP